MASRLLKTVFHASPDDQSPDLTRPKFLVVATIAFFVFLIANITHLFDPPYWDGCMSFYRQGIWLKNNGFDFVELWHQPKYPNGPNVGFGKLLGPIYGLLLCVLPVPACLFCLHLGTFALAAIGFASAFRLACRYVTWQTALLWSLAVFAQPMFSGQIAGIYVEVPVGVLTVLMFDYLDQKKPLKAALLLLMAFFVKDSTIIIALAILVGQGFNWVVSKMFLSTNSETDKSQEHSGEILAKLAPTLIATLILLKFLMLRSESKIEQSFELWFAMLRVQMPDLGVILFLSFGLVPLVFRLKSARLKFTGDPHKFRQMALWTTFVWGFLAAHMMFPNSLVRYWVVALPTIAVFMAALSESTLGIKTARAFAIFWLCFNLANQWGNLYPRQFQAMSRSGDQLERSREYLIDLELNQQLCDFVEKADLKNPIVTRLPYTEMLAYPELGYVKDPVKKLIQAPPIMDFCPVPRLTPENVEPTGTIFLFSPTKLEIAHPLSLAPSRQSKIIKTWPMKGCQPVILHQNTKPIPLRMRRR